MTVGDGLVGCVAWRDPLLQDPRGFGCLVTIRRHMGGLRQRITQLILLSRLCN
jgi:hypothetical protein